MLSALLTSTGTDTDVRTISGSHPSKAWGSYENNLARREAVARKMGIRNWLLGEEEAWDASLPLRQRQDEPQDRAQQRLLSEMTFEELELPCPPRPDAEGPEYHRNTGIPPWDLH